MGFEFPSRRHILEEKFMVVVEMVDGPVQYFGPFKLESEAWMWGRSHESDNTETISWISVAPIKPPSLRKNA